MQEKYINLRKPLNANDIELRVGSVGKKGATLLLYKTARVDNKRLHDVLGGLWKREHYIDTKGSVVCRISIYDTDLKEWVSREDVGSESNTEKEKGAYSDAFKRAGSAWGIGAELYDAPFIFVPCPTKGKGTEKWTNGDFKKYELVDPYYFNEAVVSKFVAENNNVLVEIKKGKQMLFPNNESDIVAQIEKPAPKQIDVKVASNTNNTPQQAGKHIIKNSDAIITNEQKKQLEQKIEDAGRDKIKLCEHFKVESLTELTFIQYQTAIAMCEKVINKLNTNAG